MQKAQKILVSVFFLFGEKLAFLLIVAVSGVIFLTQQTPQAFSESISGLTFVTPPPSNVSQMFVSQASSVPQELNIAPRPTEAPLQTQETVSVVIPTINPAPTIDLTSDSIWNQIAACESNGHWNDNTGNGYYGGLQFSQGAWNSVGGSGLPSDASQQDQIAKAQLLQSKRGWGVWGACAAKLGLD